MIYYIKPNSNGAVIGNGIAGTENDVPAGSIVCSQEQYQRPFDWAVINGEIVPSPNLLANAQAAQMRVLSNACQKRITSGFASSALGVGHDYASDAVSQRNIILAAQSAKGGLLSCADASGIWSRVPHTQAQAQQVAEDFVAASDAARTKLSGLETQITAAKTVEAVQAVVWESTGG